MPGSEPYTSDEDDNLPLPLADLDEEDDADPEGDATLTYATAAGPARPPIDYGAALSDEDSPNEASPPVRNPHFSTTQEMGAPHGARPHRQPPMAMVFADPEAPSEPPVERRKTVGLMFCEVTDTATFSSRTVDVLHRKLPLANKTIPSRPDEADTAGGEGEEDDRQPSSTEEDGNVAAAVAAREDSDSDSDSDHLDDPVPTPPQPQPTVRQQLPSGWRSRVDQASGKVYYWNEVTGRTQWERPTVHKLTLPSSPAPGTTTIAVAEATAPADATSTPAPLPAGWVRLEDPLTERPYYHNPTTNQTVWKLPTVEDSPAQLERGGGVPVGKVVAKAAPKPKGAVGSGMGKGNSNDFMDIGHRGFPKGSGANRQAGELLTFSSSGKALPSPGEVLRMNAAVAKSQACGTPSLGLGLGPGAVPGRAGGGGRRREPVYEGEEGDGPQPKLVRLEHKPAVPFSEMAKFFR